MVRYRPYVILNAAMTLDGKIVTAKGDSSISSRTDLIRVHELRANVDAILIGINTVETDNPMLTAKNEKKNPIRVIVDSEARIKFTTKIMRSCNIISTVIAVSHKATNSKLEKIKSRGASVLVCGMNNKVYLKKLLKIFGNALKNLKIKFAWIVNSEDGLDEISPYAKTNVIQLKDNQISEIIIDPKELNINSEKFENLLGDDAKFNAKKIVDIFNGEDNDFSKAVCLNAGAGLIVSEKFNKFKDAYQYSREHILSGKTFDHLKIIQNG